MNLPECLEIKPSAVDGLGVFAKSFIKENTILGTYTGIRYSLKEFKDKYGTDLRYCYWARRANYVICSKEERNFITFINESETPNCILKSLTLKTLKDIEIGQELFLKYPKPYPRKNLS